MSLAALDWLSGRPRLVDRDPFPFETVFGAVRDSAQADTYRHAAAGSEDHSAAFARWPGQSPLDFADRRQPRRNCWPGRERRPDRRAPGCFAAGASL